jgi:hypothetical protein
LLAIGPVVSEEKIKMWNVDGRTTDEKCNQTLLKWSLSGPLPKLCPAFQNSNQDGCHSRT